MLGFQRGLVKIEHAAEEKSVTLQQLHIVALSVAPAVVERLGLRIPQLGLEEGGVLLRRSQQRVITEHDARASHRPEHETIPRREHFIVEMRTHAFGAHVEHLFLRRREHGFMTWRGLGMRDAQNILAGQGMGIAMVKEVSVRRDAEVVGRHGKFFRREQCLQLGFRPAVELPLLALAVRVLGRIEPALGMRHVAPHVTQHIAHDLGMTGVTADEVGVEVELHELGVVVEHLLEVRHQPPGIDRVTREAAAQLIVDAARRHLVAGVQHHPHRLLIVMPRAVAQQEARMTGRGKFRRTTEPAVDRIVALLQLQPRVGQRRCVERGAVGGFARRHLRELRVEFDGGLQHFVGPCLPGLGDLLQHLEKTGPAILALGRPVGASVKRLALRRDEHVQGPAARAGHGLHEGHVNLVHVGALLAVHLDADKMFVEKLR